MERQISTWNRRGAIISAIAFCGMLFVSCSSDDELSDAADGKDIKLCATVENTTLTRSAYLLSKPDRDHPLKAAVWASTTSGRYLNSGLDGSGEEGEVSMFTTANFTDGEEQLLDDAVYPKNSKQVFFIGLHPGVGWQSSRNEGNLAVYTFSGYEDVMFAPEISGQYGVNIDKDTWPTFKFRHLLTWLRVCVKADSEIVSEAWGKLKSMKIKSFNTVSVELDRTFDSSTCLNYSRSDLDNETFLDFYKTGTDNKFLDVNLSDTWFTLPYEGNPQEVAYVLCAPVIATDISPNNGEKTAEYTLFIETEKRTVEVPVDLMKGESCFVGDTRCNQFILNLTFKMGSNVAVTTSVTDWKAGGMGILELDPNL